jgi:hypothetical protein
MSQEGDVLWASQMFGATTQNVLAMVVKMSEFLYRWFR